MMVNALGGILILGALILCVLLAVGLGMGFINAILGGGSSRKLRHMENQEVREFQELERGFRRMEERLESLETLLIGPQPTRTMERERDPEFDA